MFVLGFLFRVAVCERCEGVAKRLHRDRRARGPAVVAMAVVVVVEVVVEVVVDAAPRGVRGLSPGRASAHTWTRLWVMLRRRL